MAKYKVTESVIYSDGELCTYEYNYGVEYRDANDKFKERASQAYMCSGITKVLTISISHGDRVLKQITCSFIDNRI